MTSLDIAVMCWTASDLRRADLIAIKRRITTPPLTVIDCNKSLSLWASARKAWQAVLVGPASHGLVLQEDMLPSRGFYPAATAALAVRPDDIVCYFNARPASLTGPARVADKAWAVAPDAAWGGAVAMPKALIVDFLRWEREHVDPSYPHDDGRITLWAMATGREIWCTIPSLLQHVGAARSMQGFGGGINRNRVAAWWVDDASTIDWSRGADDPIRGKAVIGPVTTREMKRIRGAV